MTAWVIRQSLGERESRCLTEGLAFVGWPDMPDFDVFESREQIREILESDYDFGSPSQYGSQASAIWRFANEVQPGDWAALPASDGRHVYLGKVNRRYHYVRSESNEWFRHRIGVDWIVGPIARNALSEALRRSLQANGHFYQVGAATAETEFEESARASRGEVSPIVRENAISAPREHPKTPSQLTKRKSPSARARDQIAELIGTLFHGHPMETVVEAILRAQGCHTWNPTRGRDGGVDVVAILGTDDEPTIIQVKSGQTKVGRNVVTQLRQTVRRHPRARHGILVAWSGVTGYPTVRDRTKLLTSDGIAIWDQRDVVKELVNYYEDLMPRVRTAIPQELVRQAREEVE